VTSKSFGEISRGAARRRSLVPLAPHNEIAEPSSDPVWQYEQQVPILCTGWANGATTVKVQLPCRVILEKPREVREGGNTYFVFRVAPPTGGWPTVDGQVRLPMNSLASQNRHGLVPQSRQEASAARRGRGASAPAVGKVPYASHYGGRLLVDETDPERNIRQNNPRGNASRRGRSSGIPAKRLSGSVGGKPSPAKKPSGVMVIDGKRYQQVSDSEHDQSGEYSSSHYSTDVTEDDDSLVSPIEQPRSDDLPRRNKSAKKARRATTSGVAGPSSTPQVALAHVGAPSGEAAASGKRKRRRHSTLVKGFDKDLSEKFTVGDLPPLSPESEDLGGGSPAVISCASTSAPFAGPQAIRPEGFEYVRGKPLNDYPLEHRPFVVTERNRLREQRRRANQRHLPRGTVKRFISYIEACIKEFRDMMKCPSDGFISDEYSALVAFCGDAIDTLTCVEVLLESSPGDKPYSPKDRYEAVRDFAERNVSFITDHYHLLSERQRLLCFPTRSVWTEWLPEQGLTTRLATEPQDWEDPQEPEKIPEGGYNLCSDDLFELPQEIMIGNFGQYSKIVDLEIRIANILDQTVNVIPVTIPYSLKTHYSGVIRDLVAIFRGSAQRRSTESFESTQRWLSRNMDRHRKAYSFIYDRYAPALPVASMQMRRYQGAFAADSVCQRDQMIYLVTLAQVISVTETSCLFRIDPRRQASTEYCDQVEGRTGHSVEYVIPLSDPHVGKSLSEFDFELVYPGQSSSRQAPVGTSPFETWSPKKLQPQRSPVKMPSSSWTEARLETVMQRKRSDPGLTETTPEAVDVGLGCHLDASKFGLETLRAAVEAGGASPTSSTESVSIEPPARSSRISGYPRACTIPQENVRVIDHVNKKLFLYNRELYAPAFFKTIYDVKPRTVDEYTYYVHQVDASRKKHQLPLMRWLMKHPFTDGFLFAMGIKPILAMGEVGRLHSPPSAKERSESSDSAERRPTSGSASGQAVQRAPALTKFPSKIGKSATTSRSAGPTPCKRSQSIPQNLGRTSDPTLPTQRTPGNTPRRGTVEESPVFALALSADIASRRSSLDLDAPNQTSETQPGRRVSQPELPRRRICRAPTVPPRGLTHVYRGIRGETTYTLDRQIYMVRATLNQLEKFRQAQPHLVDQVPERPPRVRGGQDLGLSDFMDQPDPAEWIERLGRDGTLPGFLTPESQLSSVSNSSNLWVHMLFPSVESLGLGTSDRSLRDCHFVTYLPTTHPSTPQTTGDAHQASAAEESEAPPEGAPLATDEHGTPGRTSLASAFGSLSVDGAPSEDAPAVVEQPAGSAITVGVLFLRLLWLRICVDLMFMTVYFS